MADDPAGKPSKSKPPAAPASDASAVPVDPSATGAAAKAKPTAKKTAASAKAATKSTGKVPAASETVAAPVIGGGLAATLPVTLTVGKPVTTASAILRVGGLTKPGIYTFSLTVEDDLGAVSKPVTITVTVPEG